MSSKMKVSTISKSALTLGSAVALSVVLLGAPAQAASNPCGPCSPKPAMHHKKMGYHKKMMHHKKLMHHTSMKQSPCGPCSPKK